MGQSYYFSYTRGDLGTEFIYTDPTYRFASIDAEELLHRIPAADTPGADGEYQADSTLAGRTFGITGTLLGDDIGSLHDRLSTLMAAHPPGPAGKFRTKIIDTDGSTVLKDLYLPCRVSSRRIPERGPYDSEVTDFSIGFRADKPYWLDWALQTAVSLDEGGGTVTVTPGGTEYTAPIISLVVTTPGTILITPSLVSSYSSESIELTVTATGTYIINCDARTVTKSGVNMIDKVSAGGFFEIPPTASDIATALSGGAVMSSAPLQARRRFAFAV